MEKRDRQLVQQIQMPACEGFADQFNSTLAESGRVAKEQEFDPEGMELVIICRNCLFSCVVDPDTGLIKKTGDKTKCRPKTEAQERANQVYQVFRKP